FRSAAARPDHLGLYGSDAPAIEALMQADPPMAKQLHPALPYTGAEVVWSTHFEMARTVEDVLARRTRALFLNARAAIEMAPEVAELMARERGDDAIWEAKQVAAFNEIARGYVLTANLSTSDTQSALPDRQK